MARENQFQRELIKEIKEALPGAYVLKNDANYIQGIPDLAIFYGDKWAMLECKKSANEHKQPNQNYYVTELNKIGFAAFIYPENKYDILTQMIAYLVAGVKHEV